MKRTLIQTFALVGLLAFAGTANAAPLTLVDVLPGEEVQQTFNNPCVFGDPSCNPGLLGTYTQFPAGGSSTDYYEDQSYTVATVRAAAGDAFDIGIDVNTTRAASEVLDFFRVYIDGVLTWTYEGNQNIATAVDLKNGTGWSDWMLQSVDLTGISGTSIIKFEVAVLNAVNGVEQFFLIPTETGTPPTPTPIPEPASLLLLGTGLAGAAASARKRLKKT